MKRTTLNLICLISLFISCDKETNEDLRSNSEKITGTWEIKKTETYSWINNNFQLTEQKDETINNSKITFSKDSKLIFEGDQVSKLKEQFPDFEGKTINGKWEIENDTLIKVEGLEIIPSPDSETGSSQFWGYIFFPKTNNIISITNSELILQTPIMTFFNPNEPKRYLKTYLSR